MYEHRESVPADEAEAASSYRAAAEQGRLASQFKLATRIITEIQGGNPDSWNDVGDRLPLLSDPDWYRRVPRGYARGSEPVQYVERVRRNYEVLQWMTATETAQVRTPVP